MRFAARRLQEPSPARQYNAGSVMPVPSPALRLSLWAIRRRRNFAGRAGWRRGGPLVCQIFTHSINILLFGSFSNRKHSRKTKVDFCEQARFKSCNMITSFGCQRSGLPTQRDVRAIPKADIPQRRPVLWRQVALLSGNRHVGDELRQPFFPAPDVRPVERLEFGFGE